MTRRWHDSAFRPSRFSQATGLAYRPRTRRPQIRGQRRRSDCSSWRPKTANRHLARTPLDLWSDLANAPAMIRKMLTIVEDTLQESGQDIKPPARKAAAVAVIDNPFAGRFVEDLSQLTDLGELLGRVLGERAVRALGVAPADVESYGKAAIVGENGDLEHAAAILHPKLGAPLREAVEKGAAIIPSAKKRGGMGTTIDVPLGYKDDAWVRSHFDAMEIRVPDAPRANEIVVAIVVTDSGRPAPRIGGLSVAEARAKATDGG